MKILCFQPYAGIDVHTVAFCELMQQLAAGGAELYLLTCERSTARCFSNPYANPVICERCVAFQAAMEAWLVAHDVPYKKLVAADFVPDRGAARAFRERHQVWKTESELRAITYRDFDVGRSALGSLVTELRDPNPPLEPHRALLDDYVENGVLFYDAVAAILARFGIDKAYIFNGRVPEVRACLAATRAAGKPFCMQEIGMHHTKYSLFDGAGPHDVSFYVPRFAEYRRRLAAGDVPAAEVAKAEEWFLRRQRGALIDGKPMLQHQRAGALPGNFPRYARHFSFYLGSRDEYVCLPDWDLKLFATQEEGIRRIATHYRDAADLHLYVRIHPYLAKLDNVQTREIAALADLPNVTLIPPESPVSTYTLASQSDLNVAFGSTVGVESLFLGRPSLLLGPALYQDLPGILHPATREEMFGILDRWRGDPAVAPADAAGWRLSALAYGMFMTQFGEPFRHFDVTEKYSVSSRGAPPWGRRPYQFGTLRSVQRFLMNPAWELQRRRLMRAVAARRVGAGPDDRLP